jgi:hypothetical protein
MEADISGSQRKIMGSSVRPLRAADGTDGIKVGDGRTLPFILERSWNAPAGVYLEQWFLVGDATGEVWHISPAVERQVWGLQSLTDISEQVVDPIAVEPGAFKIVFALGGVRGGELPVTVEAVTETVAT